MAWLKLDDGFAEHPKIDPLSARAFRLHVTALCFVARNLTDGHFTQKDAEVLKKRAGASSNHVQELVKQRLWRKASHGWAIADYLDYNPTAESVKMQRKRWAEQKRNQRSAA